MKKEIKYAAIFSNREKYRISSLCKYFEVSRSGYYAWLTRKDQPDKNKIIANLIIQCHKHAKNTYGYRRVKIWLLQETGLVLNHKAILRIMRKYSLLSEIRRARLLYQRQSQFSVYENRLKRDFKADKPNQKWVTDISYIHTKQGVLYLSMIKDLYDNFIVSYDMGTVQDNALVYRTVKKQKKESPRSRYFTVTKGFNMPRMAI